MFLDLQINAGGQTPCAPLRQADQTHVRSVSETRGDAAKASTDSEYRGEGQRARHRHLRADGENKQWRTRPKKETNS